VVSHVFFHFFFASPSAVEPARPARHEDVFLPVQRGNEAPGHSSKAFARAYSKKAKVIVPSLEDYEKKIVPMQATVA
jgi:hypothetical protein